VSLAQAEPRPDAGAARAIAISGVWERVDNTPTRSREGLANR
jgi:hypothetical protein